MVYVKKLYALLAATLIPCSLIPQPTDVMIFTENHFIFQDDLETIMGLLFNRHDPQDQKILKRFQSHVEQLPVEVHTHKTHVSPGREANFPVAVKDTTNDWTLTLKDTELAFIQSILKKSTEKTDDDEQNTGAPKKDTRSKHEKEDDDIDHLIESFLNPSIKVNPCAQGLLQRFCSYISSKWNTKIIAMAKAVAKRSRKAHINIKSKMSEVDDVALTDVMFTLIEQKDQNRLKAPRISITRHIIPVITFELS